MKPIIEKFATAYADTIPQFEHNRIYSIDDFAAGMEFWSEIKRNDGGYITGECLDEMFSNMPFVAYDARSNDVKLFSQNTAMGDIDRHSYYTHWKPIIKPKTK